MKGYSITFNIYADSQEDAEKAQQSIIEFINLHAESGTAVTARGIKNVVERWKGSPLMRSQTNRFFNRHGNDE